ncbi:hypothetical protein AGLY_016407 [Aphis glycines]|uniref:Uncharacterized protein n=1 Tax=Aphis glycines TaxID=307491 RepID=A0A6G0SYZ1_APHGL|nr:hypothetical protein AGLY_016407 [Aphis glycines]
MGHILSHILNTPMKYKRFIFLESELISLSSMVYKGEIMLVVESKTQNGCRIILNQNDLMTLQNLEWTVFETITTKMTVVRPMILQQLEQLNEYFKTDFNLDKSVTLEEVVVIVKGIHNELISKHIPKNKQSFINQIKLLASEQLAVCWMEKFNNSFKVIDENDGPKDFFSPPFTQSLMPQTCEQPKNTAIDENDGPKDFLTPTFTHSFIPQTCKQPNKTINKGPLTAGDETRNLKDYFESYDALSLPPSPISPLPFEETNKIGDHNYFSNYFI